MKRKTLTERFWEKVDKNGPAHPYKSELGSCWVWTASRNRGGYGQIGEGIPSRRTLKAHRVSWELHNGLIPVGKGHHGICVLHSCDNRRCVNPIHLYLGTNNDNNRDMMEKGRQVRGEENGKAKFTEEQVEEIRRDYVKGSRTHGQHALGRKYGVEHTSIGFIVREETWKHT